MGFKVLSLEQFISNEVTTDLEHKSLNQLDAIFE